MPDIALVDDNEGVLETLSILLRVHAVGDIAPYTCPRRLLSEMESGFRPDVIVTDFYMPEMNGIELLDTIVAHYGEIPGIVVTGYPEGIQSVSKRGGQYPVLCKGDTEFLRTLLDRVTSALNPAPGTPSFFVSR